jgi:hypothetical protein
VIKAPYRNKDLLTFFNEELTLEPKTLIFLNSCDEVEDEIPPQYDTELPIQVDGFFRNKEMIGYL